MNTKTARTVHGIFGALILGCAVHMYILMKEAGDRWPLENGPGSLTQRITALRAGVDQLRKQEAQIPGRREELAAVTADYELAATVLPRESGPDQLIAAIRTKARQAGVVPTRLQPSIVQAAAGRGAQGGGAFEIWRFSLDVVGSFDQIAGFINRMEEFESPGAARAARAGSERRFFEVRELTIDAQENGLANLGGGAAANPVRHRAALVMQTYRYTGQ